jgi:hypothetical protein
MFNILHTIDIKNTKTASMCILDVILLICFFLPANGQEKNYKIYTSPPGAPLSDAYSVSVEGESVPVYLAKVAPRDQERRWKAMDDKKNSENFFEPAAFAYFDINGPVNIRISVDERVDSVKILPAGIVHQPKIEGQSVSFFLSSPSNLTVEINGEWVRSLHLFANRFETEVPSPGDPNVIYFGPGIHEVGNMVIGDNKTVYIAGGAIVRGVIRREEPYTLSPYSGLRLYSPTFDLQGSNIKVRGRGIIDGSRCTTHARNMIFVHGTDIVLEGIILLDASHWTIPVRRSERVRIDNLKLLGYRANSDGIDICNSRDVLVENCFIRTLDDLVVVKSDKGQGKTEGIITRKCVLWNEVAHALSIGAEISQNINDVLFVDCDVIHDKGREWTLRVFHADAAIVKNVRFENIRIEESEKLISLWINDSYWSRDNERGHIQNVVFKDIHVKGAPLTVQLSGFDAEHSIDNVLFENVFLNGKPLSKDEIEMNPFVRQVSVSP